jgi:hypothetical protein
VGTGDHPDAHQPCFQPTVFPSNHRPAHCRHLVICLTNRTGHRLQLIQIISRNPVVATNESNSVHVLIHLEFKSALVPRDSCDSVPPFASSVSSLSVSCCLLILLLALVPTSQAIFRVYVLRATRGPELSTSWSVNLLAVAFPHFPPILAVEVSGSTSTRSNCWKASH